MSGFACFCSKFRDFTFPNLDHPRRCLSAKPPVSTVHCKTVWRSRVSHSLCVRRAFLASSVQGRCKVGGGFE